MGNCVRWSLLILSKLPVCGGGIPRDAVVTSHPPTADRNPFNLIRTTYCDHRLPLGRNGLGRTKPGRAGPGGGNTLRGAAAAVLTEFAR